MENFIKTKTDIVEGFRYIQPDGGYVSEIHHTVESSITLKKTIGDTTVIAVTNHNTYNKYSNTVYGNANNSSLVTTTGSTRTEFSDQFIPSIKEDQLKLTNDHTKNPSNNGEGTDYMNNDSSNNEEVPDYMNNNPSNSEEGTDYMNNNTSNNEEGPDYMNNNPSNSEEGTNYMNNDPSNSEEGTDDINNNTTNSEEENKDFMDVPFFSNHSKIAIVIRSDKENKIPVVDKETISNNPKEDNHTENKTVFIKKDWALGKEQKKRTIDKLGTEKPGKNNATKRGKNQTSLRELLMNQNNHGHSMKMKQCNGWSWVGNPYIGSVFLNSKDPLEFRTCYPQIKHELCGIIQPGDCVLIKSGKRECDIPYIAKVAHLFQESNNDQNMMMAVFWFYRAEYGSNRHSDMFEEIYSSEHKDAIYVASIESKCYVLTEEQLQRYVKRKEPHVETRRLIHERQDLYNLPPRDTSDDCIFLCRKIYDFKQDKVLP